jgi:uncharacterized Zn finger protein
VKEVKFTCDECSVETAILEKVEVDRDTLQIWLFLHCPRCGHFARVSMTRVVYEAYFEEDDTCE